MTQNHAVGVDWSSGNWLAIAYTTDNTIEANVYDTIESLWADYGASASRIVVDIPIGLCESPQSGECRCVQTDGELSRRCDDLARKVIGSRSSSVFTAPGRKAARMAARGESYADVVDTNRELTGKGLMKQAANIADGIVEVEQLLLDGNGDQQVVVEGHPEVCCRAFNGEPLQYGKQTAAGVEERLCALENVQDYQRGDWREVTEQLQDESREVAIDDVLDALALALTARAPDGELHSVPQDPPNDRKDLPMQMVYRSGEPFFALSD